MYIKQWSSSEFLNYYVHNSFKLMISSNFEATHVAILIKHHVLKKRPPLRYQK